MCAYINQRASWSNLDDETSVYEDSWLHIDSVMPSWLWWHPSLLNWINLHITSGVIKNNYNYQVLDFVHIITLKHKLSVVTRMEKSRFPSTVFLETWSFWWRWYLGLMDLPHYFKSSRWQIRICSGCWLLPVKELLRACQNIGLSGFFQVCFCLWILLLY